MLANILGGNMSSRLFLQIRERRGLCYSIRAGVNGYEDISNFAISAGLNKDKIEEAIQAIREEIDKVKNEGISEEELAQAKENIRGRLILRLENSSAYLAFLSDQELFGQKPKTLEELLQEVDKITLKQVNQIAKDIFVMSQSNLALIGPFADKKKFLNLLNK
jgi:predicted Zn-dependent peptidase